MRYMVLLAILCTFQNSNSQTLKLSGGFGFNTGEKERYKRIMLSKTLQLGLEKELNWNTSLITSLEYKQFQYSYDDGNGANIYSKNSFVALPIVIRKYYTASKRSWLFGDFGISPSYYFRIQNEIRDGLLPTIKTKNNYIGFNLGLVLATGVKTKINERQSFDIGLYGSKDLFAQKRSSEWMKNSSLNFLATYYLVLGKGKR